MNRAGAPAAPTAEWRRQRERSNAMLMKLMVWISLTLGRSASRGVLHGVAAYFLLFAPAPRRASAAYLRRVLGRAPRLGERYRHFLSFASTIHDRIYLLNGRFDLFDIQIVGDDVLDRCMADGKGVLLMGAHFGSFEMLRAMGRHRTELRVAMVMYEAQAQKLMTTLAAINPAAQQDIVSVGHPESMLEVRDRLEAGQLVGLLSDRDLGTGVSSGVMRPFLGTPAHFPLGPFRMAAMLRRPVVFMTGLYLGGNRYELHLELLADFTQIERSERDAAIDRAQQDYVDRLAHYCCYAPYNWFNFFDFWAPVPQVAPPA